MNTDNLLPDSVQCTVFSIGGKDPLPACGFPPVLEKNSIHVWSARYADLDQHFRVLSNGISREEQNTASLYRKSVDAKKFILRHGTGRTILAHYIRQNPEMISFKTGKNGKPELDPADVCADVSFNLSHTSDMMLIGVSRQRRIGVDIVKMEPSYRFDDTADYMLTPAEKGFLKRTEPALRYQVFFRIWATKEALLKATGSTLNLMKTTDLSDILEEVVCSADYSMNYLDTTPPFFLWQFTNGSGHLGAIAVDAGNSP
jgi:4'-phosphopantetheinyl transferase